MSHSMTGSELQDPGSDLRDSLERWAERMGCGLLVLLGRAGRGSDLDLAISFDPLPTPEERLRIVGEIQDLCVPRSADVVFLRLETDPVLRFEIFRNGETLYERERGLFVEERVRALMLYEDVLPFRRALRRRLAAEAEVVVPEVLARKLAVLERYLEDLRPHHGKSAEEVQRDPYEIERLLELVVQIAVDIVSHDLAERGITPVSYRDAFLRAADIGILPEALATRLADAAGLRNILVHMYETIDYEIVAAGVSPALEDFGAFLDRYRRRLVNWEVSLI